MADNEIDLIAVIQALRTGAAHVNYMADQREHDILSALASDLATSRVKLERVAPAEDERVAWARQCHERGDQGVETLLAALGNLLNAYDELKEQMPKGERKVVERWGGRWPDGRIVTTDMGDMKMHSAEDVRRGFMRSNAPEPVLLSRTTTYVERLVEP